MKNSSALISFYKNILSRERRKKTLWSYQVEAVIVWSSCWNTPKPSEKNSSIIQKITTIEHVYIYLDQLIDYMEKKKGG